MANIKVTLTGALEKALKKLGKDLETKKAARVGFFPGATYSGTREVFLAPKRFKSGKRKGQLRKPKRVTRNVKALPVATVAFWNNFGTKTSPARPFFSDMIADNQDGWGDQLSRLLKKNNFDMETSLDQLGALMAGQLVDSIMKGLYAMNAESTSAMKGWGKDPLTDSGLMSQSVAHDISEES